MALVEPLTGGGGVLRSLRLGPPVWKESREQDCGTSVGRDYVAAKKLRWDSDFDGKCEDEYEGGSVGGGVEEVDEKIALKV